MTDKVYFFDSYAFFEISEGNINYEAYALASILTTKLNLFEVYYKMLRTIGEKEAELFLGEYYGVAIDFDGETIKEAAKFRLQNKQRNLSMADCIGYMLSKKLGVKFLTGDKEFENLENVEFVK